MTIGNGSEKWHGTNWGYNSYKCRCDKCRSANSYYRRAYSAGNRERLREYDRAARLRAGVKPHAGYPFNPADPGDQRHGLTGYGLGCRCDRCVEGHGAYRRAYKKRKRDEAIAQGVIVPRVKSTPEELKQRRDARERARGERKRAATQSRLL